MSTVSVILATFIALNSAGNSPEYDYAYSTNGGEKGECIFKGTISTDNNNACKRESITRVDFKQGGDLTWKILTKACPDLVLAGCGDPEWSTDEYPMDDLEWPSCNNCPRCPCNNGAASTYYIYNSTQFESPFEKSVCYECECERFSNYEDEQGNDLYARFCSVKPGNTYSSPNALENIQCPYTTPPPTSAPTEGGCSDGGNPETMRYPGQYFFYYDGANCDTYCTCNATNGLECETGWDNIMENEDLKYVFLDNCKNSLKDAWNDTSRWNTKSAVGGNCVANNFKGCPSVNCGTYNIDDEWSGVEWEDTVYNEDGTLDYILYDCVDCDCPTGSTPQCTTYDGDERSEEDCSRDSLICSYDFNRDDDVSDLSDTTECKESEGQKYCGWHKQMVPTDFDADTVCIEDAIEVDANWGCQDDYKCDAFFGYENLNNSETGVCSYNEVTFTAKTYDCLNYQWLSESYTLNVNQMCCGKKAGKQCNQQTPAKDALGTDNECTSSDAVAAYYQSKYECQYGDHGVGNNDFIKYEKCHVSLPEGSYTVCSIIGDYWKWATNCKCKEYQALEKFYPTDEYHDQIRAQLQLQFDEDTADTKTTLEIWNEAYECQQTFECDITDHVNKVNISIISVILVVVINYAF